MNTEIQEVNDRRIYTNEHKERIVDLIEANFSDVEIQKLTGYCRNYIFKISTNYWEKKMQTNPPFNDDGLTEIQVAILKALCSDYKFKDIHKILGISERKSYKELELLNEIFNTNTVNGLVYKYLTRK